MGDPLCRSIADERLVDFDVRKPKDATEGLNCHLAKLMSKNDEKPFTKDEAPFQQLLSHSLAAPRFGRLARPATLQSHKASPLNSKSTILTPDSPLREVP